MGKAHLVTCWLKSTIIGPCSEIFCVSFVMDKVSFGLIKVRLLIFKDFCQESFHEMLVCMWVIKFEKCL